MSLGLAREEVGSELVCLVACPAIAVAVIADSCELGLGEMGAGFVHVRAITLPPPLGHGPVQSWHLRSVANWGSNHISYSFAYEP